MAKKSQPAPRPPQIATKANVSKLGLQVGPVTPTPGSRLKGAGKTKEKP